MLTEEKEPTYTCFSGTRLIKQPFAEHLLTVGPRASLQAGGEKVEVGQLDKGPGDPVKALGFFT